MRKRRRLRLRKGQLELTGPRTIRVGADAAIGEFNIPVSGASAIRLYESPVAETSRGCRRKCFEVPRRTHISQRFWVYGTLALPSSRDFSDPRSRGRPAINITSLSADALAGGGRADGAGTDG